MKAVSVHTLLGLELCWAVATSRAVLLVPCVTSDKKITGLRFGALDPYRPDEDWAIAGPIMQEEEIFFTPGIRSERERRWEASTRLMHSTPEQYGPTPLVAAMRFYVALKQGSVVLVPENMAQ